MSDPRKRATLSHAPDQRRHRSVRLKKAGTQIRAVLFDFDGTLTHPGALNFPAIKQAMGCPPDSAILEYIASLQDPVEKEYARRVLDEAEEQAARSASPREGAEEILQWLIDSEIRIGIITRNAHQSVIRSLDPFNGIRSKDFQIIVTREDPVPPKPDPAGVKLAMEELAVEAHEAVMVGDYRFDMAAGNDAGVTTVLVPAEDEQRDTSGWGQDHRISSLLELKDIIGPYLPLKGGKLPNRYLQRFLETLDISDPAMLIRPAVGEDTTAVDISDEEVLILKSDPITFVSDAAARYAVTINANDIATAGARPRWFLSTLIFPPGTTPIAILDTLEALQAFCEKSGITLCGGHTEISDAVTRPVISGMIAGTVSRNGLIDKRSMSPGDAVLLTKSVAVEGTAILAQEFEAELLAAGMTPHEIASGSAFLQQIAITTEAAIAADSGRVSAMHDVTEGGLATALTELSVAGQHRIAVDLDQIPVHELTRRMCKAVDIDPLGLIGSGSLLICCRPAALSALLKNLHNAEVPVSIIGKILEPGHGIQAHRSGNPASWPVFETDELARLFS